MDEFVVWEYVSIKLLEYGRHRAETRDSWETQLRVTETVRETRALRTWGLRGADLDPKNQMQSDTRSEKNIEV